MKLKATIPVNLTLLDNFESKKNMKIPYFDNEVHVSIHVQWKLNQDVTEHIQNMEFIADERGLKGKAIIEIELYLNDQEKAILDQQSLVNFRRTEIFVFIVNDLIDIYRLKTGRWWIERVSVNDIIELATDDRLEFFPRVHSVENDFSASIKEGFENKQEIPFFQEYLLIAKKNYFSERFDLAIIFSNMALESLIFLLSDKVNSTETHKQLIAGLSCDVCLKPTFKKPEEILKKTLELMELDQEAIMDLVKKVREFAYIRNNITHGKITFLNSTNKYNVEAKEVVSSLEGIVKMLKPFIKDVF